jgi:uncharacterized metal-binding protein YceD (DUF177 family)
LKTFAPYIAEIYGLASNKIYFFEFEVGNELFAHFGAVEIEKGKLRANLALDKSSTMIQAKINIAGSVELVCDRSGEEFDYELDVEHVLIFKFSDHNDALDDDVYLIEQNSPSIDFSQAIYDLILLSIPMKKLHPRFADHDETEVIFTFGDAPNPESPIDPRWESLKNLNI